jgi:O-methyltransferase involved in polyketide biosynthesis
VLTLVWQIISWGAGFDTSFFRLATNGSVHPEVYFYEVDFTEVVDRKAECILGSKSLQECIGSFEGMILFLLRIAYLRTNIYILHLQSP